MADSNTNPYLALLQQEAQPPGWAQILQHIGNLGFGLAGGFGQAAATGQPTMAAIGPGLMMGNQMNAQAAHQAEQERMKRLEWQFKAQEHEDKRADVLRKQKALEAFAGGGFNVAQPQGPLMGPGGMPTTGGYDTRVAGLEGGTKKGGMVFNELGSGAFGPYQFMPATWAAVRAQNPSLNLPADITQASREQHDAAHNAFKAGNAQGLQAGGFQPTPENLYLAHRFGLGGALSVLRADPDKPLHEVLPIDWQRQNPDMRGQTAGGFRRLATERVGGSSAPYVVRPDAKPTQYSLMPDDVPFELSSGSMTGPRPTTAGPTMTAPVMPQPTWEKPGDIVPVNPAGWFPQQQSPGAVALPQVPAGATMQPPPAPGTPGTPSAPGGPNVVQPQVTPGPNTPPMTPGGAPASGGVPGIEPPPQKPVAPMPGPDPAFAAQQRAALLGNLIKPDEYMNNMRQHVMDRQAQLQAQIDAQFQPQMKAWEARNQLSLEQYRIAEQKAAAAKKREEDLTDEQRRRTEKGAWVRDPATGLQTWRTDAEMKSGQTQADKPPEPPAPGTTAGDDHILSTAPKDSVEYRDAYDRQAREPKVINGQAYVRDMTKVPPPTYGQPAGAPSAAPPAAPASKPSDVPGMKPIGDKNYTESQGKDYTYARRLENSIPQLEAMLMEETVDKKTGEKVVTYSTKKLPGTVGRMMSGTVLGVGAPDFMASDQAREFRRITKDIVSAVLRRESGASIPEAEYTAEYQKYIPLPGDNEKELKAKLQALKVAARTIAEASGRPLDQFGPVFNVDRAAPIRIDLGGNTK